MLNGACEHIGDRLNAAMRMPRKTFEIVFRPVIAEIIHHQEGVGEARIAEAEHALQADAGALHMGRCTGDVTNGTDGHGGSYRSVKV